MSDEIPRTALEAERFLWHVLDHVSGLILYRRTPSNEHACATIRRAIETLQSEQLFAEWWESLEPEQQKYWTPIATREAPNNP